MVFVVEGTSLELSAAVFPHYVPKQEQSSIHTQSRKPHFPPKTSWNSSSQGVLELSGLGLQDPPHLSSVSVNLWGVPGVQKLFCWEFKSFCFPQASSLEFVFGWMHLQDAEMPEFHLGMLQRERGCSWGLELQLGQCWVISPCAGALSGLSWAGRPQVGSVLLKNCFPRL